MNIPIVRVGILAVLLATGCAGATSQSDPFGSRSAAGPSSVDVTISNLNFNDATIHAIWEGGRRERVGRVTGNTTRTFTLEFRTDAVRFEIDFLAGGDFVGNQITVSPGDHVQLTLPP